MSKKSCFRGPLNKWHGKWTETLLKSERQHLYHIYWSLWRQLSYKKSLLMICKMLGLFLNVLTADDKYSLLSREILLQHIHLHLSQKWKIFSQFIYLFIFFLHFRNLDSIFNILNMTLIADVFLNLRTPKNVVR